MAAPSRPAEMQPAASPSRGECGWAKEIAKYPPGRQASAVIALLWRGQEQEGWVTHPMIEKRRQDAVACPSSGCWKWRPSTPCSIWSRWAPIWSRSAPPRPAGWRGSDAVVEACKKHIHPIAAHGFGGRQILLDGSRMPGRLRQCADAADRQGFLRGPGRPHHRKAARGFARRHGAIKPGPQNDRHQLRAAWAAPPH